MSYLECIGAIVLLGGGVLLLVFGVPATLYLLAGKLFPKDYSTAELVGGFLTACYFIFGVAYLIYLTQ